MIFIALEKSVEISLEPFQYPTDDIWPLRHVSLKEMGRPPGLSAIANNSRVGAVACATKLQSRCLVFNDKGKERIANRLTTLTAAVAPGKLYPALAIR